jgi:hypothetical protein
VHQVATKWKKTLGTAYSALLGVVLICSVYTDKRRTILVFRALPNAKVRPPPRQRRLSGDRAELLLQFGVPDDNLLDLYAEAVNVYERPLHGVATDPSGFWVAVGSFFFEPRALKAHAEGLPANWQEFCGRRGARQPGACWFGS